MTLKQTTQIPMTTGNRHLPPPFKGFLMPSFESWVQWIIMGLCFGVGFTVAGGICSFVAGLLGSRSSVAVKK